MSIKFVVCATDYDPDSGGVVCLHALAHALVELGHEASLAPLLPRPYKRLSRGVKGLVRRIASRNSQGKIFAGSKASWLTMFEAAELAREGAIFIYPETVIDNPYDAQHVVRWLLHFPMYWNKKIGWNQNDYVIRFNDAVPPQKLSGIHFIDDFLKVVKYPIDVYLAAPSEERSGAAYLVRKGTNKSFVHPADAICIDGMSHAAAAAVLKRVKVFYSYDLYTAYSLFAVLAGCESIVVPDEGLTIEQWYPSEQDRLGLAYGDEHLPWARSTAPQVLERLRAEEVNSFESVKQFSHFLIEHIAKGETKPH